MVLPSHIAVDATFFLQERRIRNDSTRLSSLSNNFDNLKQESKKYKELSSLDPLTGALNRNGFAEEMSQSWPDVKLSSNVALILIDLDYFKKINDNYGHDAGDFVLHTVASAIRTAVLGSDKLTRWGGEEFILFCNGTNASRVSGKARSSSNRKLDDSN
jgi:diguanylate cyclase (GGDEF)-like protein